MEMIQELKARSSRIGLPSTGRILTEREGEGASGPLPPWQAARVVVLWRCMRCGFEWLPGRWWRPGVTRLPLPQSCPGCGSYLWRRAPDEAMRPTMKDVASAEALARRRG
jgi:hypothetical protein